MPNFPCSSWPRRHQRSSSYGKDCDKDLGTLSQALSSLGLRRSGERTTPALTEVAMEMPREETAHQPEIALIDRSEEQRIHFEVSLTGSDTDRTAHFGPRSHRNRTDPASDGWHKVSVREIPLGTKAALPLRTRFSSSTLASTVLPSHLHLSRLPPFTFASLSILIALLHSHLSGIALLSTMLLWPFCLVCGSTTASSLRFLCLLPLIFSFSAFLLLLFHIQGPERKKVCERWDWYGRPVIVERQYQRKRPLPTTATSHREDKPVTPPKYRETAEESDTSSVGIRAAENTSDGGEEEEEKRSDIDMKKGKKAEVSSSPMQQEQGDDAIEEPHQGKEEEEEAPSSSS